MAEVTDEGFVLKTQNEYFTEEQSLYRDIDPDFNLDPSTPDGLKIAHDAEVFSNLDEAAQDAYNSKDPNKSRGVELDIVSSITGTFRKSGTFSNVELTLTGVASTPVLKGSRVESSVDGTQWATDASVNIGGGGTVTVTATALIAGDTQADPNTINKIIDSVGGWQAVDNLTVATPGTNEESDPTLRLRRYNSVARPGDNQVDSMRAEVDAVEGVRRAIIYENDTGSPDANGLPGHSLAVIADGGTDEDVALAIFLKKNPGVALHSVGVPVSEVVTSPKYTQQTKTIDFGRPTQIDITVVVDITDDGTLPATAAQDVEDAILNYTQGELLPTEIGFNLTGFAIGEDVFQSRLFTPVNNVIGAYGNSYVTLLTVNAGSSVAIGFDELSRWTSANITVNIT